MSTTMSDLLTLGEIRKEPGFEAYTQRQLAYAIEKCRVEPVGRVGTLRVFGRDQLPQIKAGLRGGEETPVPA